jgi:hypothetical protein
MAAIPWWRSLAHVVWWILSRVWAPFMAIGWPILIVYGLCNPNPVDMARLRLQTGETALLIGVAGSETQGQRSYVVFPRALSDAAVVFINDTADASMVTKQKGLALFALLVWGLTLYLTWRSWVRVILESTRGRGSPSRVK